MFADKKKAALIIAAVLVSAAALWFVLRSQAATSKAADSNAGISDASAWPSVMFTSGGAGVSATPVSGDATTLPVSAPETSNAALNAALAGSQSAIAANTQLGLNANASDLFAGLADSLSKAGLTALQATQTQDASTGATVLNATATYAPKPPPVAPAFIWDGHDYGTSANFIAQNLTNYTNITGGKGDANAALAQLQKYVTIAKTDPRNALAL